MMATSNYENATTGMSAWPVIVFVRISSNTASTAPTWATNSWPKWDFTPIAPLLKWVPNKAWRWFDVFRRAVQEIVPAPHQVLAAPHTRLIAHTSPIEQRRHKRKQWMHRLLKGAVL